MHSNGCAGDATAEGAAAATDPELAERLARCYQILLRLAAEAEAEEQAAGQEAEEGGEA